MNYKVVGKYADFKSGTTRRVEVNGKAILLANVDGEIFAVCDTCPHEDASLHLGALKGALISCPLHGSRFNVRTGEVLDEPAETDLQTFPVKVIDGEVTILCP